MPIIIEFKNIKKYLKKSIIQNVPLLNLYNNNRIKQLMQLFFNLNSICICKYIRFF